jgi:hypothetical protein
LFEQGFQAHLVFRASLIIEGQKLFFQADGIGFLGQIVSNRNKTLTAYVFSEKTQTDDINRTVFSTFNKPIGIHPEPGKPLNSPRRVPSMGSSVRTNI